MTTLFGPLRWPDTVAITTAYLRDNLPDLGLTVAELAPSPIIPPLVLVARAGGPRVGMFENARLALQAWGTTPVAAADLANECRDWLQRMPGVRGGFTVYQVTEYLGPTWAEDPETHIPRIILTVEARFRAIQPQ